MCSQFCLPDDVSTLDNDALWQQASILAGEPQLSVDAIDWISSWVGDDQRIPGVVCSVFLSSFLPYLVAVLPSVGSQCDARAPSKKSIDGLFRGGLEGAGHSIPLVIAESLLKGKG